jgi:hypothetical protein
MIKTKKCHNISICLLIAVVLFPVAIEAGRSKYFISIAKKVWKELDVNVRFRDSNIQVSKAEITKMLKNGASTVALNALTPANQKTPLTINVSPADANVRVMNIKEKYTDGVLLASGSKDIEITKDGYRTKRFWFDLNEDQNVLNVKLSKKGTFQCDPKVEVHGHSALGSSGMWIRSEMVLNDISLTEAYFSTADMLDNTKTLAKATSGLESNFAYFDISQSSNLSRSEIANNEEVYIDPDRHVKIKVGLEQLEGNNVLYIENAYFKPGILVTSFSVEKAICDGIEQL